MVCFIEGEHALLLDFFFVILFNLHFIIIRKFSSSSHLPSIEEGCTGSKYYIPQSYFSKSYEVLSIFLVYN
jgi:hypothetical protein